MSNLTASARVVVKTEGSESLSAVADSVRRIGAESQRAAPTLTPVADGIQRIGREAGVERQAQQLGELGRAATASVSGVGMLDGALAALPARLGPIAGLVAGAFATTQILDFAASLAPVADAAKNLEGRLRLAVGANGDLAGAIDRVRTSANDAGADINSVGELYGRIAASSKELGADQARVAELTDTINKSFAVSGSTAAATAGAITQLAQAFASGALRGDEFNSVSEAAPRLMQALADGLGKTRGELRAMAEQGELTSEKVLGALESQRDAINRDFAVLPETIGRATQRLSNEWQVFIGELDKTTGASDAVAGGLTVVAENLDSIAGAAATAGEVVTAALAVKAAAALRGYITLTTTSTAATTAHAAAINGLAVAGRAATGAMLTLGRALPGLAVAGVITGVVALVTEFFRAKSAAEDAEEAVRKMLEATPTNNAAKEVELVATKAEAARFKLTEMETEFDKLRLKGQDAAAALDSVVKTANLTSSDGIAALVTGLDQLRIGAQVTGEQVETALVQRLRRLSTAELRDFGIQAEMAFNQGERSAERLGIALDAQARAALQRLGIDADAALTGMSAKFREADGAVQIVAGQFERLKASGVEAGAVLQQSIDGAIKAASNRNELEVLAARVRNLGFEGKLAETAVVAALEAIRKKADEATPGINSVTEAFRELGIVSDATLKDSANKAREAFDRIRSSGTASARELQHAFRTYAERAIAANGGVASEALKVRAAMYGLRIEADETGKSIVRGMNEAKAGTDDLGRSAADAADQYRILGGVIERLPSPPPPPGAPPSPPAPGGGGQLKSYNDPFLSLYARAEQVGGLTFRKEMEQMYFKLARSMERKTVSSADWVWKVLGKLTQAVDAEQMRKENAGSSYGPAPQRAAVTPAATPETVTRYEVSVNVGHTRRTINTASASDAQALVSMLQQLEADMSRAS